MSPLLPQIWHEIWPCRYEKSLVGQFSQVVFGWIFEPRFSFRNFWHRQTGSLLDHIVSKSNCYCAIRSHKNTINFYCVWGIIADLENRKHFFIHYFKRICIKIPIPSIWYFGRPFIVHLNRLFSISKHGLYFYVKTVAYDVGSKILARWPRIRMYKMPPFSPHRKSDVIAPNFNLNHFPSPRYVRQLWRQFRGLPLAGGGHLRKIRNFLFNCGFWRLGGICGRRRCGCQFVQVQVGWIFEQSFSFGKKIVGWPQGKVSRFKSITKSYQAVGFGEKENPINLNPSRIQINHLKNRQSILCDNFKRIRIIISVPSWGQRIIQVLIHKNSIQICDQKVFNCYIKSIVFHIRLYWGLSRCKTIMKFQHIHKITANSWVIRHRRCWARQSDSSKGHRNNEDVCRKFWWLPFGYNPQRFQSRIWLRRLDWIRSDGICGQWMSDFI